MLAKIRLRQDGEGQWLNKAVDLLRFNEEAIRQRLVETGQAYNSELFVMGFEDWGVDYAMSLSQAYILRELLIGYYDGDDLVLRHLMQRHVPFQELIVSFYRFIGDDEEQALQELLKYAEVSSVVSLWFKVTTPANALTAYIEKGDLLNTERGFYIRD